MIKKILAMIFVCATIFSFAGCSKDKKNDTPTIPGSSTIEPNTDTTTTPTTNNSTIPSDAKKLTKDVKFEIANKELDNSMLPYKLNLTINVTNNEDYSIDIYGLGALFNGYSWGVGNVPYFSSTFNRDNTSEYKKFSKLKFPKYDYTINPNETEQTMIYLPLPEGINSEDDIKSLSIYVKVTKESESYKDIEYTYINIIGNETHENPPIDGFEKLYDDDEISFYVNKNIICMENHDDVEYIIVNKTDNIIKFISDHPSYSFSKGGLKEWSNTSLSDSILPHSYSHGRFEMPDFHHVYSAEFKLDFLYPYIKINDAGESAKTKCYGNKISIDFNHPNI